MNEVEPVKDPATRSRIQSILDGKPSTKVYGDIWAIGCNTGLRIGDLLAIRVTDIKDSTLELKESKTGKRKTVDLSATVIARIEAMVAANPQHEWLFQMDSKRASGSPVTRQSVARVFKQVGERESVGVKLGCHSMRKTFGYFRYTHPTNPMPIEHLQKMLNHSSPATTLRYIGIDAEVIKAGYVDYDMDM